MNMWVRCEKIHFIKQTYSNLWRLTGQTQQAVDLVALRSDDCTVVIAEVSKLFHMVRLIHSDALLETYCYVGAVLQTW
jgi:hypothetical protein